MDPRFTVRVRTVLEDDTSKMELQIVQFFNQLGQGTIIDAITIIINYIPLLIILWFVLGVISLRFDKKKGRLVFLSIIVATLIYFIVSDFILKTFIVEFFGIKLRPYLVDPESIKPLGFKFVDSSFPSGHVSSTTAVLAVFVFYYKKYWLPAILFTLFMAFARMHMGMHFPSDVLFGFIFGLIYAIFGIKIAKWILRRR
uniref:Phosphatase PAP2 family protein n=1 Tax=candidate division CPR3 bacterium TaxID=2268181 RepID=A0A7C4R505_UNCC3